jgi:hypothetical protein
MGRRNEAEIRIISRLGEARDAALLVVAIVPTMAPPRALPRDLIPSRFIARISNSGH